VLTTVRGIGFPHARQIIQLIRERVVIAIGEMAAATLLICLGWWRFLLSHPAPAAWRRAGRFRDNERHARPEFGQPVPADSVRVRHSQTCWVGGFL
jgi:hypothetical protein